MRIGMLADLYKPYTSGVTNMISLLKSRLEALGQEVFLFTFGAVRSADEEPNVIRSPGLPVGHEGISLGLGLSRRARETLVSMDVVHVHHPILSGRLALRHCRPRGIPIVFSNHTRHDLYARLLFRPLPAGLVDRVYRPYLGHFFGACDLVIVPSPSALQLVQQLSPGCHWQMIPNGIELHPFRSVRDPIRRQELGFEVGQVVLIYVGRLAREKNVHLLVEAFAAAARRSARARLLMVGGGPLRASLEARAARLGVSDEVRFAGFVPYEQVPRYLACADAFVSASVTEVHALTVIEAMACGLPVLGIDGPGVGDAVADGVTGLLSPGDPGLFGAAMVRLVEDEGERRALGARARAASQAFSIESTAEQMLRCYRHLLTEARPSSAPGSLSAPAPAS
jgi:1,2-diacylglycerol 3-alpha-glucosyltransferase